MACPHVAGLAALLLRINKQLTVNQVKQNIQANGDPIQTDKPVSSRRINAARSLGALASIKYDNTSENGVNDKTSALRTQKPKRETV